MQRRIKLGDLESDGLASPFLGPYHHRSKREWGEISAGELNARDLRNRWREEKPSSLFAMRGDHLKKRRKGVLVL